MPSPWNVEFRLLPTLVSLFRIWRLLRHLKPDIVEFSTPKAGLLGTLAALFVRFQPGFTC